MLYIKIDANNLVYSFHQGLIIIIQALMNIIYTAHS